MKILCFDLSASSGRFIVFSSEPSLAMEEVFRFPNHPFEKQGHLYWDLNAIIAGLKQGLKKAFEKHPDIQSLGIDTFGVDYVRLDQEDAPYDDPFAYRDARCLDAMEAFLAEHPYEEIYAETGIQKLPFNTLFQLFDDKKNNRPFSSILFLSDYLNFFLTGHKRTEKSIASTGAILDIRRELSGKLLSYAGFPTSPFPPFIEAGEKVGEIKKELADELSIPSIPVIAVVSHDTGSAVLGIDLDESSCYLSSGTWSLLGCEIGEVDAGKDSFEANFTNELGYRGSNRYLKNIMGLFIIQELFNDWRLADESLSFASLAAEASAARQLPIFIDVDDPIFSAPTHMEEKFYRYLEKTNQAHEGLSRGEIARIVYESLSFAYKEQFDKLSKLRGKPFRKIIVVGGGSKAELLNSFIADALQVEVVVGQSEATAYGNALAQLLALGAYPTWKAARQAARPKEDKCHHPSKKVEERCQAYRKAIKRR